MNHSLTILLVDEGVQTVGVKFNNNNTEYTYKSLIKGLKVGDAVVVEVGEQADGVALARVSNLDAEVDFDNGIKYKWIVASFDLEKLHALKKQESEIVKKVMTLELQNKRDVLRHAMIGAYGKDFKKIPMLSAPVKKTATKKKGSR